MYEFRLAFPFLTNQLIMRRVGGIDAFAATWREKARLGMPWLAERAPVFRAEALGAGLRLAGFWVSDLDAFTLFPDASRYELESGWRDDSDPGRGPLRGFADAMAFSRHRLAGRPILPADVTELRRLATSSLDHEDFGTRGPDLEGMAELLVWVERKLDDRSVHPVMVAALAAAVLGTAGSMESGEGDATWEFIGRLAAISILLRCGYGFLEYAPLETGVEALAGTAAAAARGAGSLEEETAAPGAQDAARKMKEEILVSWVLDFTAALEDSCRRGERILADASRCGVCLNGRRRRVLKAVAGLGPARVGEISRAVAEGSIHTIKKDLAYLVNHRRIGRYGRGKGTHYFCPLAQGPQAG